MSEIYRVNIIEGYDSDLAKHLNELLILGYEVRFVLPNGVNRWTVISVKSA